MLPMPSKVRPKLNSTPDKNEGSINGRTALGQAFAKKFFLNLNSKDGNKESMASILFKSINQEGGNLAKALKSIVAKKYVEKVEYEIKFHFLR